MKPLLLLWMMALLLASCQKQDEHAGHGHNTPSVYYTCSMDPQVMETKPGKCPICHMELTPISLDQLQKNGLKLSVDQERLANIKTYKVSYGMATQKHAATGQVKENQSNTKLINARIEGRIDRLYVKTPGETIKTGQLLYLIYSEMLAATQSEFIENWSAMEKHPEEPLYHTIYSNAVQKLKKWGLTETQIEQLKSLEKPHVPYPILSPATGTVRSIKISEGSTVMDGEPLFEITEYASLWVEALFHPKETVGLQSGATVEVRVEGISSSFQGKVIQILPQVAPNTTANIVRVLVFQKENEWRPGMQATVIWQPKGERSLMIPSSALIHEKENTTVWVKNNDGVYQPKPVHIGRTTGKETEVLHGLKEGDEVVISGNYLLHSEYVFKKGNNPGGHDMNNM